MDILDPMLAQSANENRLVKLCEDPDWNCERKYDGQRMVVHVDGPDLAIRSRTGKLHGQATKEITKACSFFQNQQGTQWLIDGEVLGKKFFVFDLPLAGSLVVLGRAPFEERRLVLEQLFQTWEPDPKVVELTPSMNDHVGKTVLVKHILEQRGEGLVFKRRSGLYRPGARSPDMLKVKFRSDVDAVVTELSRGGKANLVLSMYRDGKLVEVGECTALAGDGPKIKVGDVVQVRLLYVSQDFRLVQPTLPRLHDKPAEQCTWDQLGLLVGNKFVADLPRQ